MPTPILILFALVVFALRAWVSTRVGLGSDEAHYVLYGKFPALSYFDHPPLIGWIQFFFYRFFPQTDFFSRLPALLFGVANLFFLNAYFEKLNLKRESFFLIQLSVFASFLLSGLGFMFLPESLLLFLIFPFLFSLKSVLEKNDILSWTFLGITTGLMGLSKYTSILVMIPLFILFFKRSLFLTKGFFLFLGVASLCISPVLIWNIKNDFISFRYQGDHLLAGDHFQISSFLRTWGLQLIAYHPVLFVMAVLGFKKSFQVKTDFVAFIRNFGITLISFLAFSSFLKPGLPHWSALFFILFIPFCFMNELVNFKRVVYLSLGVSLFLYLELGLHFMKYPDYQNPFRDITGFPELISDAKEVIEKNPATQKVLAVGNWSLGSRVMIYGERQGVKAFVIDDRFDQFDLWRKEGTKENLNGYDLLFLNFKSLPVDLRVNRCDHLEDVKKKTITLNDSLVEDVTFTWCHGYHEPESK